MDYTKLHHLMPARLMIFFLFFTISSTDASSSDVLNPLDSHCNNVSEYKAGSVYAQNLNSLLKSIASNASITSFGTAIFGNGSDTVYGLVQCRGDVNAKDCRNCTSDAAGKYAERCSGYKSGTIWFDRCQLRYGDTNFFGVVDNYYKYTMQNIKASNTTTSSDYFWKLGRFMNSLVLNATSSTSSRLFAEGQTSWFDNQTMYGLVQCTQDLSVTSCSDCLNQLGNNITKSFGPVIGLRMLTSSCNLRFEVYKFFDDISVVPQSPTAGSPTTSVVPAAGNNTQRNIIIVVVCLVSTVIVIGLILWACMRRKASKFRNEMSDKDVQEMRLLSTFGNSVFGSEHELPFIGLSTIEAATDDFSETNKLGEGGYGPVYKGRLIDGQEIAVKRLSKKSGQGMEEFKNEVVLIAKLQHRNLVRLLGCCVEKEERLLIYEYMPNGSLDNLIFEEKGRARLSWDNRSEIIMGIARGILYLHHDSRLRIIHRDLKASNVLLDMEMNPKISDFGMARIFGGNQNEANTNRVVGTYGYMAPEYAMEGLFSIKSDVFSFGVLLLEIVSGKKCSSSMQGVSQNLIGCAWKLWSEGNAEVLVDSSLEETYKRDVVMKYIQVALLCVQEDASERPTMSNVMFMLGSDSVSLPQPLHPAYYGRNALLYGEATSSASYKGFSSNEDTRSTEVIPR